MKRCILDLLHSRDRGSSICPSEPARLLFPDEWRDHMDDIRAAASNLADQGAIEFTQGGRVVEPRAARGPVRLRLKDDARND